MGLHVGIDILLMYQYIMHQCTVHYLEWYVLSFSLSAYGGGPLLSTQTTPQHYGLTQTTAGGVATATGNFSPSHGALTSPFVRVTFGKEKKRTRTSCGPHPYWNEELTIPFQSAVHFMNNS